MQAWVSCSGSRITACDLHAQGGDQCDEQRGPDLEYRTTTVQHPTQDLDDLEQGCGCVRRLNPEQKFFCTETHALGVATHPRYGQRRDQLQWS